MNTTLNGYIPPQETSTEEIILGAILIEKGAMAKIADLLEPADFYKEDYRLIYEAAYTLHKQQKPIDIITVVTELKRVSKLDIVGGSYSVSKLTNKVASSSNIEHHAAIVKQMSMLRQIIYNAQEAIRESYTNGANPFEIQSSLIKKLQKLIPIVGADISPASRMRKTYQFILEAMASKDGISGIPYPWATINRHTGGMHRGTLITIAGLPGAMKTALCMQITKYLDELGIATLMFQQEMADVQTGIRELSQETAIAGKNFRTGKLSPEDIENMNKAIAKLENSQKYIDDRPGLTFGRLQSVATKYVQEHSVQLVIIDYLQLMNTEKEKNESDTTALERLTRNIKSLSKQLNIPIIVLSQFTKEAGKDHTKFPEISHLRGSGSIEQDSDMVWVTWNPCKALGSEFTWTNPYDSNEEIAAKGKIYLRDAKNREGSNEIFEFEAYPWINTFHDLRMLSEGRQITIPTEGLANNVNFDNSKDNPF